MPTTIKLKNSVTTTNTPTSLAQGEVAINITDKKVWVGNAATTPIQLLGAGGSASFGALTCTSLTNSGLTSGRVTYATTAGLLTDSANLTFNGTTLTAAAITSTGVATFSAGTVSAPALTTTGDTNTGIFFPAADTIAFTEGGAESMRIDSSGNVGIGTTTPATPLQVNGTITATSLNTNNTFGFKNRIINGAMVIDQRNAGASVTINAASQIFSVDRFYAYGQGSDGVYTLQQSTTAPAGFYNSLKATVTTADSSIGASQFYFISQSIEGLNTSDLNWGTANAKTVTLSFWVQSSVTGTYGGSIRNAAVDRSYVFTYTVNAANTWEYKTITIVGDSSGTWLSNNLAGMYIGWSFGEGSNGLTTAGSWVSGSYRGATGQTQLIGTLNATWYFTGVQLEVGSTATSFDYRPYGTELALCQRYYYRNTPGGSYSNLCSLGTATGTTTVEMTGNYPVQMRSTPTITTSNARLVDGVTGITPSSITIAWAGTWATGITFNVTGATQYRPYYLQNNNNTTGYIDFSAEL